MPAPPSSNVTVTRFNMSFGGGVNASAPAHLIPEDSVQTATNIDFSLEKGAARSRRGYGTFEPTSGTGHYGMFKSYGADTGTYSFYTYNTGGGSASVGCFRVNGVSTGAYANIAPALNQYGQFCKYHNITYIASTNGAGLRKDDGTNTTEWIKQIPLAPKITVNTAPSISVITGGTVTHVLEGTANPFNGTNTITNDATTGRCTVLQSATINLGTNNGNVTGTNGIIYANIGFSDPQNIYRVSIDFAVDAITVSGTATYTATVTNGTTTSTLTTTDYQITAGFQNYWHGQYTPNSGGLSLVDAYPSADQITAAAQQVNGVAVNAAQIASIQSNVNSNQTNPVTRVTFAGNVPGNIAIPMSNFDFVGTWTGTGDPWQGLTGCRITVESFVTAQTTLLVNVNESGDAGHCLTDMNIGYSWYETFAEIDANGNFRGESAPSPATGPLKMTQCNVTVVDTSTITGSISGITHIITYRQGGYAQAPYAVNTRTLATATFTDSMADITALLINTPLTINVMKQADFGFVRVTADEAFYDRVYVGDSDNLGWRLRWSQIGRPDQFVSTNSAVVSPDFGDNMAKLVVWPPGLIIINWRSVYELTGSVFEGPNADFVLQRASCRRGSVAPGCCIKTPHGIPLLSWDGITMYQPGAGYDIALPWVVDQIGDAFRGIGGDDPAALDYARVPAVNGNLANSWAAFAENKLYLAVPTGASTTNNTVFVLDFTTQKCWWYQYQNVGTGSQPINSLYWDFVNSTLYGGGTAGILQVENFVTEQAGTGTSGVPWFFKTREWTVANDTLVENLDIEYAGGPFEVDAIFDGTATITIGTCSSLPSGTSQKTWSHFPLNGLVTNNIAFQFTQLTGSNVGTNTTSAFGPHTAVYQIGFDAIPEPKKVHFFQTEYKDNSSPGDKLWDVMFVDVGMLQANMPVNQGTGTQTSTVSATGTVTAVTFVDGVAVMTNTILGTGTPSASRNIYTFSFPAETYGEIAYTTFTSTTSGTQTASTMGLFKIWDHRFEARNEPPRTTTWRTTIESLDEAICDAFDVDINPNGTVFGTCYVDNVALMTATITSTAGGEGNHRQSYTFALPVEVYGRTIFVLYNGSGGNYFKHYNTFFHRRPEPDRWTNYVSERRSTVEHHFDYHEADVNPLGNTVTGTAYIDGTAYGTFTYTGTLRDRYPNAFPADTYGKTVWTQYNVVAATDTALNPKGGRFKFFSDRFNGTPEPDRLTFVQKILPPYPSEHYIKTWIAELNPLGTCTGTLMVEGAAVSTFTFTGSIREIYNVGVDAPSTVYLQTATAVEVRYSGNGQGTGFKHYRTEIESAPKPFGKTTWAFSYKKIGGASQIDMARFYSVDVEVPTGASVTGTFVWDIDGLTGFSTNTLTFAAGTRTYIDRIPFPPGGRGRLFQNRITFSGAVKVWRSTIDTEHIGAKGVARTTIAGTPQENSYSNYRYGD